MLPLEDGVIPAALLLRHREARRGDIEATEPVPDPEPHKVDLHLIVEGLALRIDSKIPDPPTAPTPDQTSL